MSAILRPKVVLTLLVLCPPAAAETLKVPADFATITEAVAAAQDGDTISVAKGLYLEAVAVSVPNLKLVGKNAVIDAEYAGPCINSTANGVSISRFTLVNGVAGVNASGTDILVTKCKVYSAAGPGIAVQGAPATVSGNTVADCGGDGINYLHTAPGAGLVEKNVCLRNKGAGIVVAGDATTVAKNRCEQNNLGGIRVSVEALVLTGASVEQSVLIEKNTCRANGADGLALENGTVALVSVAKNNFSGNADDGIFADAVGVILSNNTCDDNLGNGLQLALSGCTVEKNSAAGNGVDGIRILSLVGIADGAGFGVGDDNTLIGNTAKGNTGDGIVLKAGERNTLESNKCMANGDDGIDADSSLCVDTELLDNTCNENRHEGLDNGGVGSIVVGNVSKNNGLGVGPDIAGTGDGGVGTVAFFEDNVFKTGGEDEPSRLDNYVETGA